uniref:Cas1_AcylT domain-containing protein n=1 Tax=Ascaris lumbricoides TaxID=6252 RepID=A0A0M3IWS5_ASCLU
LIFQYVKIGKWWCFVSLGVHFLIQTVYGWPLGKWFNVATPYANFLYQFDSIASIAIGSSWIAFPKWLLHRQVNVVLDESHELCGRLMGAYFITGYLVSSHALHWKEDYHRAIAVDTRGVVSFSALDISMKLFLHVNVVLDESHELCGRLMGAYFITGYLVSSHALHWKEDYHRAIAVDTRGVICILVLMAQVWSQYAYEKDWSGGHWVGISLFSFWTIVCLFYRFYLALKCRQAYRSMKMK